MMKETKQNKCTTNYIKKVNKIMISSALVGSLILSGSTVSASDLSSSKTNQVKIASTASKQTTVIIDGKVQAYTQPAVIKDGRILVPMRSIFETLKSKISWDRDTQSVTAKRGATSIKLTINSKTATVNDNIVELDVAAQLINGSTMVPLRFVSDALGASVAWDGNTNTVSIFSGHQYATHDPSKQVVHGITVDFGNHKYGARDQFEYGVTMKIVYETLEDYDNILFGDSVEVDSNYKDYLNGARWSGSKDDSSNRNVDLYRAESRLGELVKAGVSNEVIEKLYKTVKLTNTIAEGSNKAIWSEAFALDSSAYDALIHEWYDSGGYSQVLSAMLDAQGFNTLIYIKGDYTVYSAEPLFEGDVYAKCLVEIKGVWYQIIGNEIKSTDVHENGISSDFWLIEQPTDGTIIK